MSDLDLITRRLADLGEHARALAGLVHESRGLIDLPPERARQVLADLDHLARLSGTVPVIVQQASRA